MLKYKQAFTLIELIVVITILAILWTISFLSLSWYSELSRDSVRISDLSSIKTSLELFYINSWKYPVTSGWYDVTYGSWKIWSQWVFWELTLFNVEKLDKVPLDPLVNKEYTYSVLANKQEYELAWITEWELSYYNKNYKTYADDKTMLALIVWNYNWETLEVSKTLEKCIIAVPSIITSSWTTLESIVSNNLLVYNNYKNLPSNYKWNSRFKLLWDPNLKLVNSSEMELYCWNLDNLVNNQSERIDFIDKFQKAYSWTQVNKEWRIKDILNLEIDINNPSTELKLYTINIVEDILSRSISKEQKQLADECNTNYHEDWWSCLSNTKTWTITNWISLELWNWSSWEFDSIYECSNLYVPTTTTCEPNNYISLDNFIWNWILTLESIVLNWDWFSNIILTRCTDILWKELWSDLCLNLWNAWVVITNWSRSNLPTALNWSRVNLTQNIWNEANYTLTWVWYGSNNNYKQWYYATSWLITNNMVDNPCWSDNPDYNNSRCTKSASSSSYTYSCWATYCNQYCSGLCCHYVTPTCSWTSYSCSSWWTLFSWTQCYKLFSSY